MHKGTKIGGVWEYVKVMGAMFFAMAAGTAVNHQYIVQTQMEPQETILIYRREDPSVVISQEQEIEELSLQEQEIEESTPEEQAEEAAADELEMLAICVEAEAGNQSLIGKRMVVDVVLNRVDDSDFPDSIEEVISQKNAFTSFWDGGMDKVVEPSEETIRAVQMEIEERGWPGLFYFTAEGWPEYGTPWKQVGDHYFSTK